MSHYHVTAARHALAPGMILGAEATFDNSADAATQIVVKIMNGWESVVYYVCDNDHADDEMPVPMFNGQSLN